MKHYHIALLLGTMFLLGGCASDTMTYRAVPNINISRPNELDSQGIVELKVEPQNQVADAATKQWIAEHPAAAAKRTVLMASWRHESYFYSNTIGQTLLIFIDGEAKPGRYWLNADNSVLITYSAYSAPARERVGLTGSIDVQRLGGHEITARLAVRDTTPMDSFEFLNRPWDPVNSQVPFELRGNFTFNITGPSDPVFEKAAVKWIARDDSVAVATGN